jgi:hypothetical protein
MVLDLGHSYMKVTVFKSTVELECQLPHWSKT